MCVQSEADYRPLMTDVVQSLIPLVKQQTGSRVEILVKEMNSSKEVNLSIKEHLLTSATDMVECLRTDPSKVILLNFYLGNTEESSTIWLRIGDMAEDCYKKCAWT